MTEPASEGFWNIFSKPFRSFGPLLTPAEILSGSSEGWNFYDRATSTGLQTFAGYVTDFLTSEHPGLGRSGAVCPFIKGALERNALRLSGCSLKSDQKDSLKPVMDELRTQFIGWRGNGSFNADEIYRSVVVLFPYFDPIEDAELIERVQKSLKISYVERGLMLGEFYPTCMAPGLHNPDFRPFQAPALSLAIRYMTVFDAPFMMGNEAYIESFCWRFGESGRKRIDSVRRNSDLNQRFSGKSQEGTKQPLVSGI